jgi:hypothetical protein
MLRVATILLVGVGWLCHKGREYYSWEWDGYVTSDENTTRGSGMVMLRLVTVLLVGVGWLCHKWRQYYSWEWDGYATSGDSTTRGSGMVMSRVTFLFCVLFYLPGNAL